MKGMKLISEWTAKLSIVMDYMAYMAGGLSGVLLLVIIFCIWQSRRIKTLTIQSNMVNQLLEKIQPSIGLEKNMNTLLEIIGKFIDAPVYAFYIFDSKNRQYVLKSVRHSESDFGKIRPSYSGLTPYKKEAYMPPISLSSLNVPSNADMVEEGEVPLFILPLGDRGVIRIGPIKKVEKKVKRHLERLGNRIQHILPEIILSENLQNQVDVVVASGKALQNISDVTGNSLMTLEMMIEAIVRAVGAIGGFFLERSDQEPNIRLQAVSGLDRPIVDELMKDQVTLEILADLAKNNKEYKLLLQGEEEFNNLPSTLFEQGATAVSIIKAGRERALVLLFKRIPSSDEFGLNQLTRIAEDLEHIIASQGPLQQLSKVYMNILKQLARMMDNLNPYTVGYSDQMSRYSIVIAKELGLPVEEIRDIALAAYLSNIGVLGLSSELYQKEGKYTESEYEMMKLHSEVGASIVSVTTGNKRVASYIMHHHERMDGAGYPSGLRRNEIPMGANIIAVVQMFLAKINGRKQRDPLPFEQALQMLQSAAGSQLDPQPVNALVNWYHTKRTDTRFSERSLGACWEMCCSPSSICEHCPVYQNTEKELNCWEIEGNLCKMHGKSCPTCFVQTEFQTRKRAKVMV